MNKVRYVFVIFMLALLFAPLGFTGNAEQLLNLDGDSDETSIYGNVRVSGTPSGHLTVAVDKSFPMREIKADGMPDMTFHFVPKKSKPEYQNIAFDLEGAVVSFTGNRLMVLSADRHIILNLSIRKEPEKNKRFTFDDSPEIVRINRGIALGQYQSNGHNVDGLWACGSEAGTCTVLKKNNSVTSYDNDPLPEGACPTGGRGATGCGISCGGGQGCNVTCGAGTYACCHCTNGCHCVSSS